MKRTAGTKRAPQAPKTFDGYLANLPREQRATLEKLRKDIRTVAPEAEECWSR